MTYQYTVSVAVDSSGTPYVTYYDQPSNDLLLPTCRSIAWELEVVDADGEAGQFAELAIDGDDGRHISYVT